MDTAQIIRFGANIFPVQPERLREFIVKAFDKAEKKAGSQAALLAALGITDKTLRNWKKEPPQQLQKFVELLELAGFWDTPDAAELPAELPADIAAAIERRALELAMDISEERWFRYTERLARAAGPMEVAEIDPPSRAVYRKVTKATKKGLEETSQPAVQPTTRRRGKKDTEEKAG